MNLCFFRHGPAVPHGTAGVAEDERPLTPEGRKKTEKAAKGLCRLDLGIDRIFTSPLPRARETAEILAEILELPEPVLNDRLLPSAAPKRLLELLAGTDATTPAFVGHEPNLSGTLAQLVGGDSSSFEIKKAGMALVRIDRLMPQPHGTLLQLMGPGALRKLAK